MNPRYFRFPLLTQDPVTGGQSNTPASAAPTTPAAPATPQASAPAAPATPATPADPVAPQATTPPPAEPAEPTTLQRIAALGRNKGSLLAERDAAAAQALQAQQERDALQAQVDTLTAENAQLKKEKADIDAALQESEANNSTVSLQVQQTVASLGVAPDDVPSAESEPADFQARLQAARENGTVQTFLKENAAEVQTQLAAGA